MNSNNGIFERVCKVICQNNGFDGESKIERSTSIKEDLGFDSMDITDLWIDLDVEFDFSFGEESVKCNTVEEIVTFIEEEMKVVF